MQVMSVFCVSALLGATVRKLFVLGALAAVAACGSGGVSDGDVQSFAALSANYDGLFEEYEVAGPPSCCHIADRDQTPGQINYNGIMFFEMNKIVPSVPQSLFGRSSVTVDMAADTFSGTVTNIVDEEDNAYGGEFSIANAWVQGIFVETFLTRVSGTVTRPDGMAVTLDNASLSGQLYDDGTMIAGALAGTAQVGMGDELYFQQIVNSGFIVTTTELPGD